MSEEQFNAIKDEALILKEMNHPNIVKFFEVLTIIFLHMFRYLKHRKLL